MLGGSFAQYTLARFTGLQNMTSLFSIPKRLFIGFIQPNFDDIPDGNIILIRCIRSDRTLDIIGEKFTVPENLIYSYVKAVIVTEIHQLQVFLGDDLVKTYEYTLTT